MLDLSQLATDDVSEIDTGVTSGADSSDWDPINIDEDKNCGAVRRRRQRKRLEQVAPPPPAESASNRIRAETTERLEEHAPAW